MRVTGVVLLVLAAAVSAGAKDRSWVAASYTVDAETGACVDESGGECPEWVIRAIRKRHDPDINQWIRKSFSCKQDTLFRIAPLEEMYLELGCCNGQGCTYATGELKLRCWVEETGFHYLKYRMASLDPDGRERWRAKVPHLEAPVYPFVIGNQAIYVGLTPSFTGPRNFLVFVDLEAGRVAHKHELQGGDVEFSSWNPIDTFPVLVDGFAFLQGCVNEWSQGELTVHRQDLIVLELGPKVRWRDSQTAEESP